MKAPAPIFAAIAFLALLGLAGPLHAADVQPWPWKEKGPVDPALALLTKIDDLTVTVDDKAQPATVAISVKAVAPNPKFTELQLAYRMGDTEDLTFEFDARGRPPQDMTTQVETPVTIEAKFADPPLAKLGVVEVYAKDNCMGYSIKERTKTECKPRGATEPEATPQAQ